MENTQRMPKSNKNTKFKPKSDANTNTKQGQFGKTWMGYVQTQVEQGKNSNKPSKISTYKEIAPLPIC